MLVVVIGRSGVTAATFNISHWSKIQNIVTFCYRLIKVVPDAAVETSECFYLQSYFATAAYLFIIKSYTEYNKHIRKNEHRKHTENKFKK